MRHAQSGCPSQDLWGGLGVVTHTILTIPRRDISFPRKGPSASHVRATPVVKSTLGTSRALLTQSTRHNKCRGVALWKQRQSQWSTKPRKGGSDDGVLPRSQAQRLPSQARGHDGLIKGKGSRVSKSAKQPGFRAVSRFVGLLLLLLGGSGGSEDGPPSYRTGSPAPSLCAFGRLGALFCST